MRTILKNSQSLIFILSISILFQSCSVYKSKPITLDQAVKNEQKVKVKLNNKFYMDSRILNSMEFNKIIQEGDDYFGIMKKHGELIKTLLVERNINSINEKNKIVSTISNIVLFVIVPAGIIYTMIDSSGGLVNYDI